ncbi:hypothetical protein GCM10020221_04600 [Streptomyces thioluteus]|uniref:Uncharacterized protein n=1 Tax=Streptomyces thioluteus TaxID=66431 RepID=A0ABN3WE23_STRTU
MGSLPQIAVEAGELDGRSGALDEDPARRPRHPEGVRTAPPGHGPEGDLAVVAGQQPGPAPRRPHRPTGVPAEAGAVPMAPRAAEPARAPRIVRRAMCMGDLRSGIGYGADHWSAEIL